MRGAVSGVVPGDAGIGAAAEKYPGFEEAVALQREDIRQLRVEVRGLLALNGIHPGIEGGDLFREGMAVLSFVRILLGEDCLPPGRARDGIADPTIVCGLSPSCGRSILGADNWQLFRLAQFRSAAQGFWVGSTMTASMNLSRAGSMATALLNHSEAHAMSFARKHTSPANRAAC